MGARKANLEGFLALEHLFQQLQKKCGSLALSHQLGLLPLLQVLLLHGQREELSMTTCAHSHSSAAMLAFHLP